MENVLSVYERPYDAKNPVICLDESPKQLFDSKQTSYAHKGILYQDYEYERKGLKDIYMIVEPKGGKRYVFIEDGHDQLVYAKQIHHIATVLYPDAERITIIEDNLGSHKLSALYQIVSPIEARKIIDRIEIVRTPKHGSWLNIAECELSVLKRQGVDGRVPTKEILKEQVTQWYTKRNQLQKGVDWQFTNKDARVKLKRLYPQIIP